MSEKTLQEILDRTQKQLPSLQTEGDAKALLLGVFRDVAKDAAETFFTLNAPMVASKAFDDAAQSCVHKIVKATLDTLHESGVDDPVFDANSAFTTSDAFWKRLNDLAASPMAGGAA
jgi:hypothetical protein